MRHGLLQRLPSIWMVPQVLGWSIFVAVLVHVAGVWGMLAVDKELFVAYTPVNLVAMVLLVIWNDRSDRSILFQLLAGVASLGWIAEIIGVNTGWLFGDYRYGNVLGEGMWGVPFLIGVNWFTVVYCAYMSSRWICEQFSWSHLIRVPLSAFMAMAFDWIMEPVAVELGFWSWTNTEIPLYNYICWYAVAFIANVIIERMATVRYNAFAPLLLLVQSLFFIALRMLL